MTRPEVRDDAEHPRQGLSWTTIALIAALALVALVAVYLTTRGNSDQDKLTNRAITTTSPPAQSREKLCATSTTYELIKRELFRRAAQLRGSDQLAFDRLSAIAVVRMENPVMLSEDPSTRGVNCSGSLSLDLPPGIAVIGGRRTLSSDVDYTVTMAADGSGPVVLLKNAEAIVTPLATVEQVHQPVPAASPQATQTQGPAPQPSVAPPATPQEASPVQPPPVAVPRPQPSSAHPSFDCSAARTRGERAVCADPALAALDRQMALQYARAFATAAPEDQQILKDTAHRFYAYRDHCPTSACIADTYTGRIREIRDIADGRWQPQ